MSLQSSANADCDDKQVREREIYVSVCMCGCVCVRECVQQSVREKQTQIMTMDTSPYYKTPSFSSPIVYHVPGHFSVLTTSVSSDSIRQTKSCHTLLKKGEYCICSIVCTALKVNNSPAIAINAPMKHKSPRN